MIGWMNTARWIAVIAMLLGGIGGEAPPGFFVAGFLAFVAFDTAYHWIASRSWNRYVRDSPWQPK